MTPIFSLTLDSLRARRNASSTAGSGIASSAYLAGADSSEFESKLAKAGTDLADPINFKARQAYSLAAIVASF